MNVVSFGGGTNSAAVIIGMHKKQIPIDLIVFSDTGGEKPHTYQFIETFNDWLESHGYPRITKVQKVYKGNPFTLEEFCLKNRKFPSVAYGYGQCAFEFKIEPFEKYCNNNERCKVIWRRGGKVNRYIGYDAGEQRRINKNKAKYDADKKYQYHFPLMKWGWDRAKCIAAIKGAGLPLPGKSSCFFCPNIGNDDIQALWETYPDLFDRAIAIEQNADKFKKDGSISEIIGLGRAWKWEDYRKEYLRYAIKKDDTLVFPGFEEITGGCCCGMPCGCYDG